MKKTTNLLAVLFVTMFAGILNVNATGLYGDVNLDGVVNGRDVSVFTKYVEGDKTAISSDGLLLADLNEDGKVDKKDVTILTKHIASVNGYETLPIPSSTKVYEYGDANLDGKVNDNDIEAIMRHMVGNETLSEEGQSLADLNADKKINARDIIILMRHLDKVSGYETLPISSSTKVPEYGDVNLDGKVDDKDVEAMMKKILSKEGSVLADLNVDGLVNARDVIILMKHLQGVEGFETLPISSSTKVPDYGDLTGSGTIDNSDLEKLKDHVSGKSELNEDEKKLADLNGDGKVDEEDVKILETIISDGNNQDDVDNPSTGDSSLYLIGGIAIVLCLGAFSLRKAKN